MIILFIFIANAIAVQCIGYECFQIPYHSMDLFITAGTLELLLEIRGFIKIYRRKGK